MNAPFMRRASPAADEFSRPTLEPVRGKHGKARPLEARTNWGPWLPATEASPEVAGPLHAAVLAMLAIAIFLFLTVLNLQSRRWR